MPPSDDELLYDIVDYAREAVTIIEGRAFDDMLQDRLFELGLTRLIEIIGEAARLVSDERRQKFPDVPWREITAMRHRLVHGYRDIDLRIVWNVATTDVPALLAMLDPIINQTDEPLNDSSIHD